MYHYNPSTALEELTEESTLPNPVHVRDMLLRQKLTPDQSIELNRMFVEYQKFFGETQKLGKEILRRVSRGLVSDETLAKKKRGFFRSAASAWIQTHSDGLERDLLLEPRTLDRGLYRPEAIKALVDPKGPRWFRKDQTLLALVLLEKWQRLFIDGDGAR